MSEPSSLPNRTGNNGKRTRPAQMLRACAIVLASALLGACATQGSVQKPQAMLTMPPAIHATSAEPEPPAMDLWSRLRRNFAFAQCGDPRIQYWLARYTRHPDAFERQLLRALPRLRYISNIMLDAGLPAEFTLLPWVESNFRPLRARGNNAAGIWQIMPETGRELGLRIDHHHDGRLDLDQSTRAVARMLWRDQKLLGDWRLTDMAFNAGVYGIQRLLEQQDPPLVAQAIPEIGVKTVTLNHLAKLQALACIVRQPGDYDIRLPAPHAGPLLVRRVLPKVLELPVAARLSGMSTSALRKLNPAILESDQAAHALLMPARSAIEFSRQYAALDKYDWQQWQRVRLSKPGSLIALAHDKPERAATLARVNHRLATDPLPPNSVLWLPVNLVAALPEDARGALTNTPRRYTVHAGDSLWSIARRFDLNIGQIRSWNRLRGNLLHLGQVLILEP